MARKSLSKQKKKPKASAAVFQPVAIAPPPEEPNTSGDDANIQTAKRYDEDDVEIRQPIWQDPEHRVLLSGRPAAEQRQALESHLSQLRGYEEVRAAALGTDAKKRSAAVVAKRSSVGRISTTLLRRQRKMKP